MDYEERVMQFQQNTIKDVLRQVHWWTLLKELYKRIEMPILEITLTTTFFLAIINKLS